MGGGVGEKGERESEDENNNDLTESDGRCEAGAGRRDLTAWTRN